MLTWLCGVYFGEGGFVMMLAVLVVGGGRCVVGVWVCVLVCVCDGVCVLVCVLVCVCVWCFVWVWVCVWWCVGACGGLGLYALLCVGESLFVCFFLLQS